MTTNSATLTRDNRLQMAQHLTHLMQEAGLSYDTETFQNVLNQYSQGIFRLLVVGEIKKGKSSFINALLGDDHLVPTSSDIATSTVYKIVYGSEKKTKVFLKPKEGEEKGEVLTITSDEQLAKYGTEDGNPNNCKGVNFIGIELPHPLLKSGLVVIDTPGLGGLFREHAEITWQHVPKADAVFFVLDSVEAVMSRDEQEFLRKIHKITPYIFFVQTKIDLADSERWQEWQRRNLEIISEEINVPVDKIPYYPLSSRLKIMADQRQSEKHLERSGFQQLLNLLQTQLMRIKEQRLTAALDSELAQLKQQLNFEWRGQLNILKTENETSRKELQIAYQEASDRLNRWQKQDYPNWQNQLRTALSELQLWARTEFSNQLDPSPHRGIVGDLVNQIRASNPDAKALNTNVSEIQSLCIDMCSQVVFDLHQKMNVNIESRLHDLLQQLGTSMDMAAIDPEAISAISIPLVDSLNMRFDEFDEIRNYVMGGSVGTTIATGLTSLVALVFPPVGVVVVAAGMVGYFAGGHLAEKGLDMKRADEAIQKLQGVLSDSVRQAQTLAMNQLQTSMNRLERKISSVLQTVLDEKQRELTQRKQELEQTARQTQEERQYAEKALMKKLQSLENIIIQTL